MERAFEIYKLIYYVYEIGFLDHTLSFHTLTEIISILQDIHHMNSDIHNIVHVQAKVTIIVYSMVLICKIS